MRVHSRIRFLRGFTIIQYIGEITLKGGGLGQFASLRGGAWQKRGRWCFEVLRRGVNTLVQAIDDVAMATWGPF